MSMVNLISAGNRFQFLIEYFTNGMDAIAIFMEAISTEHRTFAFPISSGECEQIPCSILHLFYVLHYIDIQLIFFWNTV